MRRFTSSLLILTTMLLALYAMSNAQETHSTHSEKSSNNIQKLKIVPLVTVKPGETKELLLSTWCTVGATRGGGFSLAEMRDGKPRIKESKLTGTTSYSDAGVTISVPDWSDAEKFAASSEYSRLKQRNISAFKVTVTASSTAESGLLEMHLLDSTCAGQCTTDFRVLVVDR